MRQVLIITLLAIVAACGPQPRPAMTDVYFRLAGGIAEPQTVEELREAGVKEGTTTMTATVPQAQATEYAEEVGVVPTYAGPDVTVEGFLQFNGVDQGGAGNK